MNNTHYQKSDKSKAKQTQSTAKKASDRTENYGDWGMSAADALRVRTLGK